MRRGPFRGRPALHLGIIAGAGTAIGYGFGALVASLLATFDVPEPPERVQTWA